MLDFCKVRSRMNNNAIEIYPEFLVKKTNDLMIRGRDFYAIWNEETGLWSTDEFDAIELIDKELYNYKVEKYANAQGINVLYLSNSNSSQIDKWHKYCRQQMVDNYHNLDEKLIFQNDPINKKDYASKRLPYSLTDEDTPAFDSLLSVLYDPEELAKIEWAIGAIVNGDSRFIQKFMVMYGSAGTGKSTVLNIIQKLFDGYCSVFDAKALGSSTNSFALEAFKTNPLVAIQHDGDLSRIEDNTRLNSVVSHELMTVNEKFRPTYSSRFKCFLFMGTNKPVRITDARSGLTRRLIDVIPTGNKVSQKEYKRLYSQIDFELGAIANKCLSVYNQNPDAYDDYIPIRMMSASNDMYNFMLEQFYVFREQDTTTLKQAWELYKTYVEDARVTYPMQLRIFKEELKAYFIDFKDRARDENNNYIRNLYLGFKADKFTQDIMHCDESPSPNVSYELYEQPSILDDFLKDCPAQYATDNGRPEHRWTNVKTTLKDIDTSKLHYVKLQDDHSNHIVIDFDIQDENGNKDLMKNLEAASKWPRTYMELSKSGSGVHLHYNYSGDVSLLSSVYDKYIEIKVFSGNSSLRRQLTKCNNVPIATISSGLPQKGKKMVSSITMQNEKSLRTLIEKNLKKEYHSGTKPSIDFIYKVLEDAYTNGMIYDVNDMHSKVLSFAAGSTHHSDYCVDLVSKMHFSSDEGANYETASSDDLVFFDIEIFPNLFIVVYKEEGENNKCIRMINPEPKDLEILINSKLVGFNNRRYDNHIIYARYMGYTIPMLYNLSKSIVSGSRDAFFREAYNLSYTDVYDFAYTKQSLKKWEIELKIRHKELGLPWDQPVDESMWETVAEYCENDVISTEAVFHHLSGDWAARQILADIANGSVNDSTNSLTTKIIFGNNRTPQSQFNYRNMGEINENETYMIMDENSEIDDIRFKEVTGSYILSHPDIWTVFDKQGRCLFPGYTYNAGVSKYKGIEVGEGGRVMAEPGMYVFLSLLDIASQHPHSIIAETLFGEEYTKRFEDLVNARIAIKHEELDKLKDLFSGKIIKYIKDKSMLNDLAWALKIAINSVYGLTDAAFSNPFRDPRNIDNIVAKRGALFMCNLQHEVERLGYTVAHIKTDSIKIPDADTKIINFVNKYGSLYGYTFEHEATYEKMCLVNNAVYIAKNATADECLELYGYVPGDNAKHGGEWTATGAQFAVPYVFKTLFSHEPIEFYDYCETKSVTKGNIYLDFNENLPEGEHDYQFVGRVGLFTPILPGHNAGRAIRAILEEDKYYAVTGTKDYLWMESESVKGTENENYIDTGYYNHLVDDARDSISNYGDLEWFLSSDPVDDLPWRGKQFETSEDINKIFI